MEIILLERVKHLGDMGAIVAVKPGYARNFLIPGKKALRATEENKKFFADRKADLQAQSAEKYTKAQGIHAIIDKNFVTVIRQAGEDGKLFGSVSPRDIADLINSSFSQKVVASEVVLEHAIKYVGVYEVTIALHSDLHAVVYVNVSRTQSGAEEAKKEFLAPPAK
jgi:large subunit ribosomal protein L9